jgi:hypothetical protein
VELEWVVKSELEWVVKVELVLELLEVELEWAGLVWEAVLVRSVCYMGIQCSRHSSKFSYWLHTVLGLHPFRCRRYHKSNLRPV